MILQKMIQTRYKSQGCSIGRVLFSFELFFLPFAAITKWWNDLVAVTVTLGEEIASLLHFMSITCFTDPFNSFQRFIQMKG